MEEVLNKWRVLIDACVNYYVKSEPTGLSDSEYDELEKRAIIEDNFYVRDYVFENYLKGTRAQNSFIEKFKKEKVNGSMFEALKKLEEDGSSYYYNLKYDGCSIAIYIDPTTGVPKKEVTVGNLNLSSLGIDQTWKLHNFIPTRFPKGIVAVQAEALIDINRLSDIDPEKARQKTNGLINSKYCDVEVNNLITLRAYRYYTDDTPDGIAIRNMDYREVLESFQTVYSPIDGHVLFSPAQSWTLADLASNPDYCEHDRTETRDGIFLNDGWIVYDKHGICQKGLKFSGAGEGEVTKTTVKSIQWNNQSNKGKDSWSANVIIDPVTVKGCVIKKPSAGSVSKLVKNNITPGAQVSIIMANSTIPMVSEVFSPGNGDFMWPTCTCGYHMSSSDVYGSLLKCGNPKCSDRKNRMKLVLSKLNNITELDLGSFLVIDRFKWQDTDFNLSNLLSYVENDKKEDYKNYLMSYMKTDLQKRNMELVWEMSWEVLRECYLCS